MRYRRLRQYPSLVLDELNIAEARSRPGPQGDDKQAQTSTTGQRRRQEYDRDIAEVTTMTTKQRLLQRPWRCSQRAMLARPFRDDNHAASELRSHKHAASAWMLRRRRCSLRAMLARTCSQQLFGIYEIERCRSSAHVSFLPCGAGRQNPRTSNRVGEFATMLETICCRHYGYGDNEEDADDCYEDGGDEGHADGEVNDDKHDRYDHATRYRLVPNYFKVLSVWVR